jgi:hypothetical protein
LDVPLLGYYDFCVLLFFFQLILAQRPGYLFADLIGARSDRTSNFIFPSISSEATLLVREIRYTFRETLPKPSYRPHLRKYLADLNII